ncbi:MAG TPA: YerC/YecD family TrpR-related protein [Patescibacteria group bacterium]|nr:YerC/YecD family TrpR-related protein [Patescibacteria group bacterium]
MSLKNEKDVLNFLRDLCTLEELEELSQRWETAKLLHQDVPYRQISEKTGLSTTTITRIAFWLRHGEGGYKKALEK